MFIYPFLSIQLCVEEAEVATCHPLANGMVASACHGAV
jgi:hypothetical protein